MLKIKMKMSTKIKCCVNFGAPCVAKYKGNKTCFKIYRLRALGKYLQFFTISIQKERENYSYTKSVNKSKTYAKILI